MMVPRSGQHAPWTERGQSGGSKVRAEGDAEGNGKYSGSGYTLKVEPPGFIG